MCNGHARYCGPGENLRGDVFHQPGMLVTAIQKALCKTGCARVIPILSSEPLLASVFASSTLKESIVASIGLLPVIASVENFCDPNDLEEYQQYRCVESASEIGPHILAETCAKLIASLSARIHNGAVQCKCHKEGTLTPACDKDTGVCHCRTGVSGERCDRCARNRNQAFPSCSRCHVCFDRWDNVMSSLSRRIQKLLKFAGTLAEKRKATPGCDFNFKGYEKKMSDLGKVLKRPFPSSEALLNIKKVQDNIRQKVSHMFLQPGPLDQFLDLHRVIENLHKDVDNLSETLQKRKDLQCGMTYLQFQDFFNKIKNYYQIMLAAEKRIQGVKSVIAYGGNTRSKVFALLNDLDVKENITLDQLRMFTVSEIEDLNEKVR
ncbi:laminin subunit beta-4 [Crotalus adamanteus]|uniref:Laminin subunit beta-4 n=1 Tax=Crotalus adamanteus TaxID=8729 RepID=A0AAW1BBE7_CROAD